MRGIEIAACDTLMNSAVVRSAYGHSRITWPGGAAGHSPDPYHGADGRASSRRRTCPRVIECLVSCDHIVKFVIVHGF